MSTIPEADPSYLVLVDHSASRTTVVKQWCSIRGAIEIGRAPKHKALEAQDRATSIFRSDKTKVMSSAHARVEWRDGLPHLSDLGSTNGTFVNDVQLDPGRAREIRDGDKVTFGRLVASRHHGGQTGEPLILTAKVFHNASLPPSSSRSTSPDGRSYARKDHWAHRDIPEDDKVIESASESNDSEEEEDVLASSDSEETGPACTLAPRPVPSQSDRRGWGLSEEDLLASSGSSSHGEEEDDDASQSDSLLECERGAETVSDSIEQAKSFFESIDSKPFRLGKGRQRVASVARSLGEESEAPILRAIRFMPSLSTTSHGQAHPASMAASALDLSTPLRLATLDRALLFPTHPSSYQVAQAGDDMHYKEAFAKEAEVVSQLPSPELSDRSSPEVEVVEPVVATESIEEKPSPSPLDRDESSAAIETTEPRAPQLVVAIDNVVEEVPGESAKNEEDPSELSTDEPETHPDEMQPEITGEDKTMAETDDEVQRSCTIDLTSPESDDLALDPHEELDACDFDGIDPAPHGVAAVDLTFAPVEFGLFEAEVERDDEEDCPDDFDGTDPDFDDFQPLDGVDPDLDATYCDIDMVGDEGGSIVETAEEVIEQDEQASPAPQRVTTSVAALATAEEPVQAQDPHLAAVVIEKDVGSFGCASGSSTPSLKRRLSETDLEEEEEDYVASLADETWVPDRVTPEPKRRRITSHLATFAVGLLTGVVGAIAGLSAIGASLEDDD